MESIPAIQIIRDELNQALDQLIAFHSHRPDEPPSRAFERSLELTPEQLQESMQAGLERSQRRLDEALEKAIRKNQALDTLALTILRLRRHPTTAEGALKAAREFASYRLRVAAGPDKSALRKALLPWVAVGFKDVVKGLTRVRSMTEQQLEEQGEQIIQEQSDAAIVSMKGWSKFMDLRQAADDDLNTQLVALLEGCRSAARSNDESPAETIPPAKRRLAMEMLAGRLEEVANAYLAAAEKEEPTAVPISDAVSVSDTLAHARKMLKYLRAQSKSPEGNRSTRAGGGELAIAGALGEAYVWLAELAPAAPADALDRVAAALAKIDAERQGLGFGGFLKQGFLSGSQDSSEAAPGSEDTTDEAIARLRARWDAQREDWRNLEVQQRLQILHAVTAAIDACRALTPSEGVGSMLAHEGQILDSSRVLASSG